MKTAIVFQNNKKQLVLTPEDEHEKDLINLMFPKKFSSLSEPYQPKPDAQLIANIHLGRFYECQGGWYREGNDDKSLIIVFDELKTKES